MGKLTELVEQTLTLTEEYIGKLEIEYTKKNGKNVTKYYFVDEKDDLHDVKKRDYMKSDLPSLNESITTEAKSSIDAKFLIGILGNTWSISKLKPEDIVKYSSDLGDINIVLQYKGKSSDHGKIAKMKSKKQDIIQNKVEEMDIGYRLSHTSMKTLDDSTTHIVFSFDKV